LLPEIMATLRPKTQGCSILLGIFFERWHGDMGKHKEVLQRALSLADHFVRFGDSRDSTNPGQLQDAQVAPAHGTFVE